MTNIVEKTLQDIEKYLIRMNISAREFGLRSVKDTNLVYGLRQGREMRQITRQRVINFMLPSRKKNKKKG